MGPGMGTPGGFGAMPPGPGMQGGGMMGGVMGALGSLFGGGAPMQGPGGNYKGGW
jgi:hypothetical protein